MTSGPSRGGSSQRGNRGGVSEKRMQFVERWSIFSVGLGEIEGLSLATVVVVAFTPTLEVEVVTSIRAIGEASTIVTIEKVTVHLHRM